MIANGTQLRAWNISASNSWQKRNIVVSTSSICDSFELTVFLDIPDFKDYIRLSGPYGIQNMA